MRRDSHSNDAYDAEDDGRTVASMSEVRGGMPSMLSGGLLPGRARGDDGMPPATRDFADEVQDDEERAMVILGTLRAALSVGMVYVVGFGIAIALMVWLWT